MFDRKEKLRSIIYIIIIFILILSAHPAHAYIGPGAGFAFISSFFVIFLTFVLAFFSILVWPLRFLYRSVKRKKNKPPHVNRVVVLGLDGLSPEIVDNMMKNGSLPNFALLKEKGYYSPLKTTNPPISPVAWSSFQTGVNPAKHNIFDFLGRDPKAYLPILSFSRIEKPQRSLEVGKYRIPLSKPRISLLRKSKTFWSILGENGISSAVLRVPVTFPPEKFPGFMLSAMGAPDLKGTQGTFTYYTTRNDSSPNHTGGVQIQVERKGNRIKSYIPGPENPFLKEPQEMKIPFTLDLMPHRNEAKIRVNGKYVHLKKGDYSDWLKFYFRALPGVKINGIARLLIRRMEPDFDMYLTPINIDPAKPAMPISHPFIYSIYLSNLIGNYATLGEAEDTWALNEKVINEEEFLNQCYTIYSEREKMFFQAFKKTKKGVCVCVFDTSDRIQHMFWKPPEDSHPRIEKKDSHYPVVIEELYRTMDDLLGKVLSKLEKKDILFVLSDHGIKSFRRCFNLNTWLNKHGYLSLKDNKKEEGEFFANVDWEKTRAYGVGMAGIYINQKGREAKGIVDSGQAKKRLKKELQDKLTGLMDQENGKVAILRVYDTEEIYSGPYRENGPDLIIGCNDGYRVSWESVMGKQGGSVFEDNNKRWQADHCVDSSLVPGVLFCSRKLKVQGPEIIDLAPTVLSLFGIMPPTFMDGKVMKVLG